MDYGGSLENCWRRESPVGSNPTPSAIIRKVCYIVILFKLLDKSPNTGEVAERLKATVC